MIFENIKGVPKFKCDEYAPKNSNYCVLIPIINEGERIKKELLKAQENNIDKLCDIIICDGGSKDGCTDEALLRSLGVNTLLTKQDIGKQGAQLRMGYDFIQGSRFVKGGQAINTPLMRLVSVRLIHAPVISLTAHQWFTDTTNAYRAYSRKYITHPEVQIYRDVFMTYELLAYLSVRASQLKLRACEIPVTRQYPKNEKTPTKISPFKGNAELMKILFKNLFGCYKPKNNKK